MSEKILCGPCGYAENNKNAENWCTVCEEGLCADCEKVHKSIKTSRNHRLISIEDFRQIQHISISLTCKDHDKRLELYCKTHDVAVCFGCVPSHHRTCSDVIPLDKAAENAKHSTALADLEDTLTGTLQNLEQIITDRESALENFASQKQTIKQTINDTRAKILIKLDDLEQKLLHELDTKHENCKSEANQLLNQSKKAKRDFNRLLDQTAQLKSFASEIHLFLGTRQINEAVFKKVESVKEGIKSVQNVEVTLHLNPSLVALIKEVDHLGNLSVKKTTTSLPFKEVKVEQAQIQLRLQDTKSISSIRLRLKKRFSVEQQDIETALNGCTMLPNGNVLLANFVEANVILEFSEDGKHIRDIPCPGSPFDLTVIDTDRIAVTRKDQCIEILNKKTNTIEETFELKVNCYGISYQDNTIVIVTQEGIEIIDVGGKVLKTLTIDCGEYIGTSKDRIYFTVAKTVHCISMAGNEIWVRKEQSLAHPFGIAVDEYQNVFIVDKVANSLIVIQHDGKSSRTLLSTTDGLDNPRSLHYNNEKKVLLLCDDNGCYLYTLE
ncbi:tripartite motif-containing protein 2/3 [Mytilus galloprovincialis]|uniref:Tripartite motif-containing protein 2/3 n=1 Tax=Mytilus galloprovincialis TaxID=29158 RepID=A0A8B6H9V9_MYTGA|nr:tripartite motif-containing protein 2/3 [Mytilus galloprovincialis]VDI75645.1 tripartite motif-containing protein 2/3 [Mytilus galloprovincialis]